MCKTPTYYTWSKPLRDVQNEVVLHHSFVDDSDCRRGGCFLWALYMLAVSICNDTSLVDIDLGLVE